MTKEIVSLILFIQLAAGIGLMAQQTDSFHLKDETSIEKLLQTYHIPAAGIGLSKTENLLK